MRHTNVIKRSTTESEAGLFLPSYPLHQLLWKVPLVAWHCGIEAPQKTEKKDQMRKLNAMSKHSSSSRDMLYFW